MSCTASPSTGRPYGVKRVCSVWGIPRSSFYSHKAQARSATRTPPCRRGPKPKHQDEDVLRYIAHDLETSPFHGEGYRKVWARLRRCRGVNIGAKRVLRLMREASLLSPRRVRQGTPHAHDGRITTDAPNRMWGTDGARIFTEEEGWVWLFVAVEHWNAECVGWHVSKVGSRFAALQPVAEGLTKHFGSTGPDAGRGLALRMDHGTQYMSDHFHNQVKYWGIHPSYAFVSEPETNGVAERFIRTLKEQAINGRRFKDANHLRAEVGQFVELYNRHWRVEKLAFATPYEARYGTQLRLVA